MLTSTKLGLVLLLLLVLVVNVAQTSWETSLRTESPITDADYSGAYAVQQFEPAFINFEFHDRTSRWATYAFSTAYFILFPVLALGTLIALARRPEIAPFRVLCLAVAIDYVVSLPFFLWFPVPERWAYPESNAVLLSDQWSSALINSIRPLSALNNSFPSTHVSLTVVLILVCWVFHVRLRATITALGAMVVLATSRSVSTGWPTSLRASRPGPSVWPPLGDSRTPPSVASSRCNPSIPSSAGSDGPFRSSRRPAALNKQCVSTERGRRYDGVAAASLGKIGSAK
jgi:hypothetical protein